VRDNLTQFPVALARLVALLALLAVPAGAQAAAAQPAPEPENEGDQVIPVDLEKKMRPVSGKLFIKESRFEISPTLMASLADPFFQKYGAGLKLDYHLLETFSFGVYASYSLNTPSGLVSVCKPDGTCSVPQVADMTEVPGKLGLMAGLDLLWSPIYGKLSLFSEAVAHFDLSFIAGASVLQYQSPGGADTMTVGGHIGLGQRYFLTDSVALRIELRDYIYSAQTVQLGDSSSKLENQLMFELGVAYFAGSGRED
jgi:outer membrane beta-barrel protein